MIPQNRGIGEGLTMMDAKRRTDAALAARALVSSYNTISSDADKWIVQYHSPARKLYIREYVSLHPERVESEGQKHTKQVRIGRKGRQAP